MFATLILLRHINIAKLKCRENFITNVFDSSWDDLNTQEKLETMHGYVKFWGINKVHYGPCENGKWPCFESTGFCNSEMTHYRLLKFIKIIHCKKQKKNTQNQSSDGLEITCYLPSLIIREYQTTESFHSISRLFQVSIYKKIAYTSRVLDIG